MRRGSSLQTPCLPIQTMKFGFPYFSSMGASLETGVIIVRHVDGWTGTGSGSRFSSGPGVLPTTCGGHWFFPCLSRKRTEINSIVSAVQEVFWRKLVLFQSFNSRRFGK